jgi:hypothetical protein
MSRRNNSIRKQMNSNPFMDERSVKAGESAENSFPKAAKVQGMETRPASRHEQRVDHIDFWMSPKRWRPDFSKRENMADKPRWSVEVKAMKRISRASPKPQSKWLWIEFKNITGGPGWIYGSAKFIATEVEDGFYLLPRQLLLNWATSVVDREDKVTNPNQAQYKSYTRHNRDDEMTLVELQAFLDYYLETKGKSALFMPKKQNKNE